MGLFLRPGKGSSRRVPDVNPSLFATTAIRDDSSITTGQLTRWAIAPP
jgi:hypothetical protein